jgi:hypothetical protein
VQLIAYIKAKGAAGGEGAAAAEQPPGG